MQTEMKFGLNILENMLQKAFKDLECERVDCIAYNVNLDYVLSTFESYDSLSEVNIYSNSEHITVSKESEKKIHQMEKSGKINFFHISKNENTVHAKAYRFWKDGEVVFGAVGSPNLSPHSNQNFESLLYVYDSGIISDIWMEFKKVCEELSCSPKNNIPESILQLEEEQKIDDSYLEGLWEHQKDILRWAAKRRSAIINIPPGTGKTRILLSLTKYILDNEEKTTIFVLVPTSPLIEQWKDRLDTWNIENFEWRAYIDEEIEPYFASPSQKAVVTLYSRLFKEYKGYLRYLKINIPKKIIIVSDECQKWYGHLDIFEDFNRLLSDMGCETYNAGLSATIQSFKQEEMEAYISLMGGEQNKYGISLPAFYSNWNDLNSRPILKPIKYYPIRYPLSDQEMEEYRKLSQRVGMEAQRTSLGEEEELTAAIVRARWARNREGGVDKLKEFLASHMEKLNESNSIIFVQTNKIAENIRDFITDHPGWDKKSSAYVYDSSRTASYQRYAMDQFKKNRGFCLISERMLREGFDLPKISKVVIHGSHTSPRDWLQKIGRAIRYDPSEPDSIAEVIDVIIADSSGEPLPMEKERSKVLHSISK